MIGRTFFRLTTHLRHRDELRVRLVLLGDVGQAAEDQHPHDDHQHQQPELFVTKIRGRLDYSNCSDNAG